MVHRTGENMRHVDALSRAPDEEPREVAVADLNVMTIRISQNDWLLTMQLQDPKMKEIVTVLLNES